MPIGICHFAVGVSGALALLIWQPALVSHYIGNLTKNDVFFVLGSGIWAMIPDIGKIFTMGENGIFTAFHSSQWSNIFWGHVWMDVNFADTAFVAAVPIAIAAILLFMYKGVI